MKKVKKNQNLVAKYAAFFNKSVVFDSKTKYSRKAKHRHTHDDASFSSLLAVC